MSPVSKYTSGKLSNPLSNLEERYILQILSLSCASNDLTSNHEAISKFPLDESVYFFYNSISIVREVAKLVVAISKSDLSLYFSKQTELCFNNLRESLVPFEEGSLLKSILIPIRNANFHYSFPNGASNSKIMELLTELKSLEKLNVGVMRDENHLMSTRYEFANWFRNEYINSHLNNEVVETISTVSVEIIGFVDSLLADLMERKNG